MAKLKRTIGWKTYSLFGLGNIVGAGIYVLIGGVAGESGDGTIWSFLIAGSVALLTATSYSRLASKYPLSAGEVVYILKGFSARRLAKVVGLILVFSGIVSAGVLLNGFAGYVSEIADVPRVVCIILALVFLAIVAIKGIKETAGLAVLITILEVIGLLIIIASSIFSPGFLSRTSDVMANSFDLGAIPILLGSFLAFYAYIGFEDMVNVAEEVKNPKKNIKKSMLIAVVTSIVLYIFAAIASLTAIPADVLSRSGAPLSDVFHSNVNTSVPVIAVIGVFAIINGIIAQIVMSSRVLHGLARENLIHKWFGEVSLKTNTPIKSTIFVAFLMLISALSLPLLTLATMTSLALLVVFSIVHISCIRLSGELHISRLLPLVGLILNTTIICVQIYRLI